MALPPPIGAPTGGARPPGTTDRASRAARARGPRTCSHLSSVLRPEKLGSWMTRARGRGREELEVYERAFGSHVARHHSSRRMSETAQRRGGFLPSER